jgi:thioredoxin
VKKLTTQELEVAISSRDKPMVIDFFATWCGPCVMLSKVLEQLATELGESVDFVKVDTDEEVELSTYFQIQGLPTLMFLGKDKGGKVLRAEGLLPAEQIRQMIEDVS